MIEQDLLNTLNALGDKMAKIASRRQAVPLTERLGNLICISRRLQKGTFDNVRD